MSKAVLISSMVSLLAAHEALACKDDVDCKGSRICVESRCVEPGTPAPAPEAPPASAPAPAPKSEASEWQSPPLVPAAPAAEVAKGDDDNLLDNAEVVWSVSGLVGVNSVSDKNGSQAVFHPDLHVELGAGIPTSLTRVFAVAYLDGGAPTDFSTVFGLSIIGAGLGIGNRYRLTLGGGLALLNDFSPGAAATGPWAGGNFTAHASAALTQHLGIHLQFSYCAWSINNVGINSAMGAIGFGYTT